MQLKNSYGAWMTNSNGLYRDNLWTDSVCPAKTHGILRSEAPGTVKPASNRTLEDHVPSARLKLDALNERALFGHPCGSLTSYGDAPPVLPFFPFQKFPLVIRTFPAAFPGKTGGKAGCSWHVPCFYLLLRIEMIETAGIGPGQQREAVTGKFAAFVFQADDQ